MSSNAALAVAEMHRRPLNIIVGPTAAGKSAIALELARRSGGVIMSADSRQVYRGFDIGTAKPSEADRKLVRHRGIDVADPGERYSAARWSTDARRWIGEAADEGSESIVVGGTGFYVRSLVEPLFRAPPLDEARRAGLASVMDAWSLDKLRRWVSVLDPSRAHLGPAQLRRAVETALLAGRRISELHAEAAPVATWPARYLVVDPGVEQLRARIERRVDAMFRAGWEDEVRALRLTVAEDAPAWNATGYDFVRRLADGSLTQMAAREAVIIATRQYAKRQRTWIRNQLPAGFVTVVDPTSPDSTERVAAWWSARRDPPTPVSADPIPHAEYIQ